MSASTVIPQLNEQIRKCEDLRERSRKLHPTDEQWDTLGDLSSTLVDASIKLQREIRVLKETRTERAWKESEKYRTAARSARGQLFAKGRLFKSSVFRRNIAIILQGPKDSTFDSEDTRLRRDSTRSRCATIRTLNPDGVISWALAYAPTLWAGGSMSLDIFECLINDIEPDVPQKWPAVIGDTLHKLKEDEKPLDSSPEYHTFSTAIECPSHQSDSLVRLRKRTRVNDEGPSLQQERQIQHMFSKAPCHRIPLLGELLSRAVQASHHWKVERELAEPSTDCLTMLIPKNPTQDISITLWVGQETGVQMINVFQLQPTWSS